MTTTEATRAMRMSGLRVLELYCGIGGCAAALGERASIVAAVDQSRRALAVYSHNFGHPTLARTVESVPDEAFRDWDADLWWLSPPCQPFTSRGQKRDSDDARTASLRHLLARLEIFRPRYLALENVPPFHGSQTHARLLATLYGCGYAVQEIVLCPTELGVPNRRRRYYLVAALDHLLPPSLATPQPFRVADILDEGTPPDLYLSPAVLADYAGAIHIVDAADATAETHCFTAAYGRSTVHSGSYLRTPYGVRRFSPQEILRLLGFPSSYSLPAGLPLPKAWSLVGNSLSVPAVRYVLSCIRELHDIREASDKAASAAAGPPRLLR